MGRRSLKLKGKEEAVIALLKYLKHQSGMTLLELECEFTPRPDNADGFDNGGRQWSRWILGKTQPKIEKVIEIYNFVCDQLIRGIWKENGSESDWAQLLPVMIEPKIIFMTEKKSTLLKILVQLEEPLVTKNMLRAISAGYYIPSEDEIHKIFWAKREKNSNKYGAGHHVITAMNQEERNEMEALMTDILGSFGISEESRTVLEEFAKKMGLVGNNPISWADQIHQQILLDAQSLSQISYRAEHIYPNELKWTDDLDDEVKKISKRKFFKMQEELAIVSHKLQDYFESMNSMSKTSRIYGFLTQMSYEHFLINGCKKRIGWSFPSIEIL